jgi:hypothetical protein
MCRGRDVHGWVRQFERVSFYASLVGGGLRPSGPSSGSTGSVRVCRSVNDIHQYIYRCTQMTKKNLKHVMLSPRNADYSMYSTFLTASPGSVQKSLTPFLKVLATIFVAILRDVKPEKCPNSGRARPPERQDRIGELYHLIVKVTQVQRGLSRWPR